jgi:transcriptional accessory protein Tex/SPT6
MDVIQKIAGELAVHQKQVTAAVSLLDEGATVPFIARYRNNPAVEKPRLCWLYYNI